MTLNFRNARDPISSFTHFLGAIFAILETIILIVTISTENTFSLSALISVLIFGFSMLALYSASSIYHYVTTPNTEVIARLRKLDHAMIYVLIAGSYTPIYLGCVERTHAYIFLSIIWAIAIIGIIVKMFWMNAPRWISTSFYLLMGWAIVFDWRVLTVINTGALSLIAAGGIAYTIGGIIYIIKKPQITENFGFHELFHIFIMLGTLLHFLAIWLFII
ncbi:MAG: hemolysin III family protein [Oscillospiraceae bacterium]